MSGSFDLRGEEQLLRICREAIDQCPAEQAQVTVTATDRGLTRFAGSMIHQNVSERDCTLTVKAVNGKRVGFASTNQLSEAGVRETAELAARFAASLPETPDFRGLPEPGAGYPEVATWFGSTASLGPEERAAQVAAMAEAAKSAAGDSARLSGSLSQTLTETAIVNSLGIEAYLPCSMASLVTVCQCGEGVGYASACGRDAAKLDFAASAREAADVARLNVDAVDVQPGEYDVVLMPYAVINLLGNLRGCGLDALRFQEGRSFMAGKIGQKIVSEKFSLWDDGADERGLARPFDGEGVAKQRVELITEGVARGVVYDSYTAGREGRESTGHGTGGGLNERPAAMNMYLGGGGASVGEMIASTAKGLLITRFNYTNLLRETDAVVTGMTRDGTFLIEGGRVTRAVKNLRFTESLLRAFSNLESLGSEIKVGQGIAAPAAKIRGFRFTSGTEF